MDDLIAFLRARLSDTAAGAEHIHDADPSCPCSAHCEYSWGYEYEPKDCDCGEPARVLAEVDAQRRRINAYTEWQATVASDGDDYARGVVAGFGVALRLDALAYAGHADYREWWRL